MNIIAPRRFWPAIRLLPVSLLLVGILTSTSRAQCTPAPAGLVSWWRGDNSALDSFGTNYGTLQGGVTYETGKVGPCFSFDGSSGYVQASDTPAWAFGTSDFTIEFWVRFNSIHGNNVFLGNDEGGGFNHSKWLFWLSQGNLRFHCEGGPTPGDVGSYSFSPALGQFYHLALTRKGNLFTFLVNGVTVQTIPSTLSVADVNAPLTIGGCPAEGVFNDCAMDEVSIYNRALTSNEIAGIYNADGSGKCSPVPISPSILTQPTNQSAIIGRNASFNVIATGDSPLVYQWFFNQAKIVGATNSVLTLTDVQSDQAGAYSVQITNGAGSILSSNALLTAHVSQCTPSPANMISFWQGEFDTLDSRGTNNCALLGGVTFVSGEVGTCFHFDGSSGYLQAPDSSAWAFGPADFTIEFWVRFNSIHGNNVFLGNDEGGGPGHSKWLFWLTQGNLQFHCEGGPAPGDTGNYAFSPAIGQFYHLALTRNGNSFILYVNGTPVQTNSSLLSVADVDAPLTIGGCPAEGVFTSCDLDEISIYKRGLSSNEIATIYNAGVEGKCAPIPVPAGIVAQPTNITAVAGQSVAFRVTATGDDPLSYQWLFNGTNIDGATNAQLIVNNVQQEGAYSVLVSNLFGIATSSNALLFLVVSSGCITPPVGLISWWRAEGTARDSGTNQGTLQGSTGFTSAKVGLGFDFHGAGYVQVDDSPDWAFGTDDFTIETWVSFKSIQGNNVFVATDQGSGINNKWIFWLSQGKLQFFAEQFFNTAEIGGAAYTFNPSPNQFYHLAVTRSGSIYTFYVDGNAVEMATNNLDIPDVNAPLTIGAAPSEGCFLDGILDEMSIYHRALSSVEIKNIYLAQADGKCPPPPMPPTIFTQPTNKTATVGQRANFQVVAAGDQPFSYQWLFNGTNITDATNAILTLNDVQFEQAGNYSVFVTNYSGSILSSNALLTVTVPVCVPPPSGLVSWWRAEGDADDDVGSHHGILQGGTTFVAGKVGQGFRFDGTNGYVLVPDSSDWAFGNSDFTIEFWVNFNSIQGNNIFLANDEGGGPRTKWIFWLSSGHLQFYCDSGQVGSYSFSPEVGRFYHIALTRNGDVFTFYIDGLPVETDNSSFAVTDANAPLTIGGCPAEGPFSDVIMDEISIYTRGLTSDEITSIYNSTVEGKCPPPPTPPTILTQPTDQSVTVGDTASFSVFAFGGRPLSYQWQFNGIAVDGASNSTLTITNAQRSEAGNYSVLVTNVLGSVISSNAVFIVDFPPASVQIGTTNGMGGSIITIPITLQANGNEAAFGFSIKYDRRHLTFLNADLADSDADATMFLNTNSNAQGRVGIAIIPPDTFSSGAHEILLVTFQSQPLLEGSSEDFDISFSDDPLLTELIDPQLRDLTIYLSDGTITLDPTVFEGDVSPRPNGNQTLSTADWLQAGRFIARLDMPSSSNEFQRIDSAPRLSQGDGQLKVTDWVQTGRYFSGADPLSILGGPTSELSPTNASPSISRLLYPSSTNMSQGQSATVSVKLDTQGNENAVGFTLGFDPTAFTFGSVTLGSGMSGVNLIANTSQTGTGKLGVILALSPGSTFAAGTKELVKVNLTASPSTSGAFPLTLTDLLVTRCISDPLANELPASYSDGILVINAPAPPPFLTISQASSNVIVSWPLSASNFVLQISGSNYGFPDAWTDAPWPLHTNGGEISVMTSVTNQMKFFRLHR